MRARRTPVARLRSALSRDPLHLRRRPADLATERKRAREVVDVARAAVTGAFEQIRQGRSVDVASLRPVVDAIAASILRHPQALPSVTRLKQAHEYTYLHSVAVCGLMLSLARELHLPADRLHEIGLAGLLHDIGKAAIPVALLDKPGPLDLAEYALVQQHTTRGRRLLVKAGIESDLVLDVCLHHHERVDGTGYPAGRGADELSIHARMAAVCDVYDAVTSQRAYKRSWSPGEALEWMGETTGQFDKAVFRAFRPLIGVFPVGTLVLTAGQRLAVVVDDGERTDGAPAICPFLCAETRRTLTPARVSSTRDPILSIEQASRWGLEDWDARRRAMLTAFPPA